MKKMNFIALGIAVLLVFASNIKAQEKVKIGTQTWTKENLNVSTFRNGDKIKQITNANDWMMAGISKQPAWCYFEFDEKNGEKYGKLYNGYAVFDKRGLAPKGWKIPSDADWKKLEIFIGKNANKLKADQSNETGFSALYSGSVSFSGSFMGQFFFSWTSTPMSQKKTNNKGFRRRLNDYNINIDRSIREFTHGFAVRCIKE